MINLFETEKEMLKSAEVLKRFDFSATEKLAKEIGSKRIILTGMGSSVLFPAAQAKHRALELNIKNRIEVYLASELLSINDFSDSYVVLCSNSGMTKETILLQEHLKDRNAKHIAITAVQDSILSKRCKNKLIMQCGFEKGVAATKSVVEQGLILDSLIFNLAKIQGKKTNLQKLKIAQSSASRCMLSNTSLKIPEHMLITLAKAPSLYLIGRATGVGDEIALKSHEIIRKSAFFYPDTSMLHGIEESIKPAPIILLEPSRFRRFTSDFDTFAKRTDCSLFSIGSRKAANGIRIKSSPYFENYCLLAAGWGLLLNIAKELKLDIDKPKKISKIGNPYKK